MKVPPLLVRKASGLRRRSFVNGKHGPKSTSKAVSKEVSIDSDGTDSVKTHHYGAPSEVSTSNSESSSGKPEEEVKVDWATATMAAESGPTLFKKKRTRSLQKFIRGGARRTFSFKQADRLREFSVIDSPIESPTPVVIPYDPTSVTSESTHGGSQSDNIALHVRSRGTKKLAPPQNENPSEEPIQDDDGGLSVDSFSNPFSNIDSKSNPFDNIDHYSSLQADFGSESDESSEKDAKSQFSIPLSYFLKKTTSWGMSAITEPASSVGDASESKIVMQERHWGKEVRSRSRDSTSWIPTEEERYKIAQGFVPGEENARDDESTSSATTGVKTEATDDTGVVTEGTEYTNDTTSAYTGYSGSEQSSTTENSFSTTKSYVTTATGDTSMFSLDVDESSKSTQEFLLRKRPRTRRHLIKSDRNIIVEVFSDLRLLAEDLAEDSAGCQGCFVCA